MDGKWIKADHDFGTIAPVFFTYFSIKKKVKQATLKVTSIGVYEANINEQKVGNFYLAPGWTVYKKRLQIQEYDVTDLIKDGNNLIEIMVGKGWYKSYMPGWIDEKGKETLDKIPTAIIADLKITFDDNSCTSISTNHNWLVKESAVRFNEIYHGEVYNESLVSDTEYEVVEFSGPSETLILQEGPMVTSQEILLAENIFTTPKGECVIDFGQEITGLVDFHIDNVHQGDRLKISFGEMLDKDGNFYNENYRGARCLYEYTCSEGVNDYRPHFTFYGFRYIRIDEFPLGKEAIDKSCFKAVVIHSEMERTAWISTGNQLVNRLIENVFWGQKGNFVDVPTDCPQRDERLGWTGDAQVFIKTACINFDCEKFWKKWLKDLAADQREDGMISHVCPEPVTKWDKPSAAWGDAAVICPMELYTAYGDIEFLKEQYPSMCKWVDYIGDNTTTKYLWTGGTHYGDWLGLDAAKGDYTGATRHDFIASAYYAYSTSLVIKAGKITGADVEKYQTLYNNILSTFHETYKEEFLTQTECVLALHFNLTENRQKTATQLAEMIMNNNLAMQTGFVGTPYLLHVLSDNGYEDLAYKLLLREQYPSWLYPVKKGATTIWEHWDGIMDDGSFWSMDMNSFNHYAYGCVLDWIYTVAAGIRTDECIVCPHPNKELSKLECTIHSRKGTFFSKWQYVSDSIEYEIHVPVKSTIIISNHSISVEPGIYRYN